MALEFPSLAQPIFPPSNFLFSLQIFLIDSPGVCAPNNTDTPQDILLRGVVRVENVENPEQYIPAVLSKTKPQHIERTYQIKGYTNHIEFLELLARKGGRLLHGGEPDLDGVAKMVLNDFLRGKIPWFTPPPLLDGAEEKRGIEGREGRLGEMGKKRRLEDESVPDISVADLPSNASDSIGDEDEFEGFNSDGAVELEDIAGDVDEAFGLESDDDSESGLEEVEEAEEDKSYQTDEAQEQLQEELNQDVDLSELSRNASPPKKRRKA